MSLPKGAYGALKNEEDPSKTQQCCFRCPQKKARLQCVACLRAGRKTVVCSTKCLQTGWTDHTGTSKHAQRPEYSAVLSIFKHRLRPGNSAMDGLNRAQKRAMWLDLAFHTASLLGLEPTCGAGVRVPQAPSPPKAKAPLRNRTFS